MALATSGATTLVTLMATEAWTQARARFAALLGRGRSDEAELAGELEELRTEVVRAQRAGDAGLAEEAAADWRGRLRRALRDDPEAVAELRSILAEFAPAAGTVVHNSISGGTIHGSVVQGGDIGMLVIGSPPPTQRGPE